MQTLKVLIHQKGGEGSGNFGHEGRPGMVGGSATQTASGISVANYDWLKQQHFATADVDSEDEYLRNEWGVQFGVDVLPYDANNTHRMVTAISKCGVPIQHLKDLNYLVAFTPTESKMCIGFQNAHDESDSVVGLRHNQEFSPVAAHEIGHHVLEMQKPANAAGAGLVMQRLLGNLRDYGLRKRSMDSDVEFLADTYKIALLAKPQQRFNLLSLWNKVLGTQHKTLLDIFT